MATTRRMAKAATKEERSDHIRTRIEGLVDDLRERGFDEHLAMSGPPAVNDDPDFDPKTGGYIGKVREPLGSYLQRVSVMNNYAQRPPFEHANDPIYRRLIRDFIHEAVMPESKIAALDPQSEGQRADKLLASTIQYSIVDGLQRFYCYALAILLVLDREKLVDAGLITREAWDYFEKVIADAPHVGTSEEMTQRLLQRPMRYEVFWNIDLAGLLHYMVTFNTGQRKMSLPVQLEIMSRPLLEELDKKAGVPIWFDREKVPGRMKPKNAFPAAGLVLGTQAFLTHNAQVTAGSQAESLLEREAYLDTFGDIEDVVTTLKRIAKFHQDIAEVYQDERSQYILSNSDTFFLGLMAACGYIRSKINMKSLEGSLDKLEEQLVTYDDDPLKIEEYREALNTITTSRGKAMRRLVYDTFLRFLNGASARLEWLDTAQQITG